MINEFRQESMKNADVALITSNIHINYFLYEYGLDGILMIRRNGKDHFYCCGHKRTLLCESVVTISFHNDIESCMSCAIRDLACGDVKTIGLEIRNIAYQWGAQIESLNLSIYPMDKEIIAARMTKDVREIYRIEDNIKVLSMIIQQTRMKLHSSTSEKDIIKMFRKCCIDFGVIECFISAKREFYDDNFYVSIDCGVEWEGYYSDITRNICVSSCAEELLPKHLFLCELIEWMKYQICEGVSLKGIFYQMHKEWRKHHLYAFLHKGYGHMIGKNVHEPHSITWQSDFVFREGMVFTLEPALGGNPYYRIEDMFMIKGGSAVCLTEAIPRNLWVID